MKAIFTFKSVYVKQLVYPANQLAKDFTNLVGTLTLPASKLSIIQDMGIEVTIDEYELDLYLMGIIG